MLASFYNKQPQVLEAGLDEAGRGCYAGPVFAAAVILPKTFEHPLLNDSKKLTEAQRLALVPVIKQAALAYSICAKSVAFIEQHNILKASIMAMHQCIDELTVKPHSLLVDGNRFIPYPFIPHTCIVQGDGLYASIAAASVLAKTARDEYMQQLHQEFPMYGWLQNKGYGTLQHRQAIEQYGLCQHHRKTFNI